MNARHAEVGGLVMLGLAVLAGCASRPEPAGAATPARAALDGRPDVLMLRIAKADGSGIEDAGPVVMTKQTQEFLEFMRVSSVTLTPDGRIVSFSAAAPADLPEGTEESYESVVTDRYGRLISGVSASQ